MPTAIAILSSCLISSRYGQCCLYQVINLLASFPIESSCFTYNDFMWNPQKPKCTHYYTLVVNQAFWCTPNESYGFQVADKAAGDGHKWWPVMAVKDVSKGQDSNHLCQGSALSKEYIAPVHSLCLDKGMDVMHLICSQPIAKLSRYLKAPRCCVSLNINKKK